MGNQKNSIKEELTRASYLHKAKYPYKAVFLKCLFASIKELFLLLHLTVDSIDSLLKTKERGGEIYG